CRRRRRDRIGAQELREPASLGWRILAAATLPEWAPPSNFLGSRTSSAPDANSATSQRPHGYPGNQHGESRRVKTRKVRIIARNREESATASGCRGSAENPKYPTKLLW